MFKVNTENCIGCGACEGNCPEVFRINDEGVSCVICKELSEELKEKAKEAMEGCPTGAIVEDEEEK